MTLSIGAACPDLDVVPRQMHLGVTISSRVQLLYDLIVHVEAESPEAVAKFALAVGSQGNVRSKTLQAFTEDQFREIVQSLPK